MFGEYKKVAGSLPSITFCSLTKYILLISTSSGISVLSITPLLDSLVFSLSMQTRQQKNEQKTANVKKWKMLEMGKVDFVQV